MSTSTAHVVLLMALIGLGCGGHHKDPSARKPGAHAPAVNANGDSTATDTARQETIATAEDLERTYARIGRTADEILSHVGKEKPAIITLVLNYRISRKREEHGAESLTDVERRIAAVNTLDAEVNNGGFDQYFFNTGGGDAEDALAGLGEIGATRSAGIFKRVLAAFPNSELPKDSDRRVEMIEKTSNKATALWDQCSDEFYDTNESLDEMLVRYAVKMRAQIRLQ